MTTTRNGNRQNDKKSVPLGTDSVLAVEPSNPDSEKFPDSDRAEAIKIRYALQETAQYLLRHEPEGRRILRCGVQIAANALQSDNPAIPHGCVTVARDTHSGRASYSNLMHCESPWVCPVCSAWKTEQDKKEVNNACVAAAAKGMIVIMVTYTQSHIVSDVLSSLLQINKQARRWFKSNTSKEGYSWQDLKTEYGLVGGIINLECTHGKNSWHPHNHELIFIDPEKSTSQDISELRWKMARRWQMAVEKFGGSADMIHGFDLRYGDAAVSDYIAKIGCEPVGKWSIEAELTKSGQKKGRGKGRTAFQLLYDYRFQKDKQAGALFIEFAREFAGSAHIRWSQGLRELLELDTFIRPAKDETENHQAELPPDYQPYLAIPLETWKRVVLLRTGRRAQLLLACESGEVAICELFASWQYDGSLYWYSDT